MSGTRDEAYQKAEAICSALRERGDELSLSAAAEIEGTLDAFATLTEANHQLRENKKQMEKNSRGLQYLWARVPYAERMKAAHGASS